MLDRLELLIGKKNIDLLKNKAVLIVGLGGVGGHALESLARSGIGTLIIVDSDTIDITNLNRQIISNKHNIGLNKVDAAKDHIEDISDSKVIPLNLFLAEDNIDTLLKYNIDYIVDACDTIETKYLLIKYAIERNIKIITCMGTAKKMHPELLKIMDINKTSYDPIAKILRKKLRDNKIKGKVMCVSSEEIPKIKEMGSNSLVPSVAGILCASYVINDIVGDIDENN